MTRNRLKLIAWRNFLLLAVLGGQMQALYARAQDAKAPYPTMAPLEQYLTERSTEIALARTAAPSAISDDAKILVFGPKGYETAVEGKNGFVCLVERGWMSGADAPEFWNPKIRGPICFNPPAARSILPITYFRTQLVIAGKSEAQIMEACKEAFASKELPALEPGAMSYMMSKEAYLTDHGDHKLAHLMFYTPEMAGKAWGADVSNSPVGLGNQFTPAEPVSTFIVAVPQWSDGTAAPPM
jgi:hypothetical protein